MPQTELPNMKPEPFWRSTKPQRRLNPLRLIAVIVALGLYFTATSAWVDGGAEPAYGAEGLNCHKVMPGGVMMQDCNPDPMPQWAKEYYQCLGAAAIGGFAPGVRAAILTGAGCGWAKLTDPW